MDQMLSQAIFQARMAGIQLLSWVFRKICQKKGEKPALNKDL
jgi:hypothetical protein